MVRLVSVSEADLNHIEVVVNSVSPIAWYQCQIEIHREVSGDAERAFS